MGKKPCENQERLRVRSLGWIALAMDSYGILAIKYLTLIY